MSGETDSVRPGPVEGRALVMMVRYGPLKRASRLGAAMASIKVVINGVTGKMGLETLAAVMSAAPTGE